jgi:nucleoside-diphosphate-sugar epimerase
MKKKICLIGGCGFIGHNLALELKSAGHSVTVIDSLSINNILSFTGNDIKNKNLYNSILNSRIDLLKKANVELLIQDAREYHAMSRLIEKIQPDIIVHLAAVSHANKSNKDPHTTFDHSLRTLENTLDLARGYNAHVIYISSSMVYGNFEKKEVNEDDKCDPIGIYGSLKYSGELIVKAYNQVFDLPYTIIRPSALYGERCVSRRVGQIFIENSLQDLEIDINGDGEDKLDFTYIEDLVSGLKLCCENKNSINQTFNLTYGSAKKISELIDVLKSEFPKTKINFKEREKFMPERGTLSIKKAKDLLGYEPKNPIKSGYIKYIQWYKEFWNNL